VAPLTALPCRLPAGIGAYIFAKKEINADRQSKLEQYRQKQDAMRALEDAEKAQTGGAPNYDSAGSPSQEATSDPAPTRHEPATAQQQVTEKSKYESSVPYRSRKGDRFS
jgi:hypothetical protein